MLVVGESLVDVVGDLTLAEQSRTPGGSPLNVAVGLARLGWPPKLATCLGDDALGALVREHAEGSGVVLTEGSTRAARTGTATATLDASGAASYAFDLHWNPVLPPLTHAQRLVHCGSLGTVLAPGAEWVERLAAEAAEAGVPVSYDPNVRPALAPTPTRAWDGVRRVAANAAVVKVSDEDLAYVQPGRAFESVAEELLARPTTGLVVVTVGAGGAAGFTRSASARVGAPVVAVTDTVGAGDSFMAALLAALLESGSLNALGELSDADLGSLLRSAVDVAALTCTRRGADPPWRHELPERWPDQSTPVGDAAVSLGWPVTSTPASKEVG